MSTTPDLEGGFDAAARRYDLLTALNPGYHRALRDAARSLLGGVSRTGRAPLLLDLGCGSGLSTRALLAVAGGPVEVLGVDASDGMLARARAKGWPQGVRFRRGRAQALPAVLAAEGVGHADGILAAYLLRNVPVGERDGALRAMHDALLPGAPIVLHEYSLSTPRARAVWTAVCRGVVVPLAVVTQGNPDLYRYLWRSVLDMEPVGRIERRLRAAGFEDVRTTTVGGWAHDILHTITARRPTEGEQA